MATNLYAKSAVWSTLIIGVGYACMKLLSPSREQMLEKLPIHERQAIEAKMPALHKKNAELFDVLQKNIHSEQPVWKVYHKDKIELLEEPAK